MLNRPHAIRLCVCIAFLQLVIYWTDTRSLLYWKNMQPLPAMLTEYARQLCVILQVTCSLQDKNFPYPNNQIIGSINTDTSFLTFLLGSTYLKIIGTRWPTLKKARFCTTLSGVVNAICVYIASCWGFC